MTKRVRFLSWRNLLIAVGVYAGMWMLTAEVALWQLAGRCEMEGGRVAWFEQPSGHANVTYFDASGAKSHSEGFRLRCPLPFIVIVYDDDSPNCGAYFLWLFGYMKALNESEHEDCAARQEVLNVKKARSVR